MSKRADKRAAQKQASLEKQHAREAKNRFKPDPKKEAADVSGRDYESETVIWSFELFDNTDWRRERKDDKHAGFCEVSCNLKNYSSMTWSKIALNPKRDHPSPIARLCKEARDRIAALKLDDIEELYRFRFSGEERIWGIRDRGLFKVLWWDPDHQVYETNHADN